MPERCDSCKKVFNKFKKKTITERLTIDNKEISVEMIVFMCPFCSAHCYEVLAG